MHTHPQIIKQGKLTLIFLHKNEKFTIRRSSLVIYIAKRKDPLFEYFWYLTSFERCFKRLVATSCCQHGGNFLLYFSTWGVFEVLTLESVNWSDTEALTPIIPQLAKVTQDMLGSWHQLWHRDAIVVRRSTCRVPLQPKEEPILPQYRVIFYTQ